jgi:hypothetical protein
MVEIGDHVVTATGPEHEHIGAVAPGHAVVAGAASQHVVACVTEQPVIVATSPDDVVVGGTPQPVGLVGADDPVGTDIVKAIRGGGDFFDLIGFLSCFDRGRSGIPLMD